MIKPKPDRLEEEVLSVLILDEGREQSRRLRKKK